MGFQCVYPHDATAAVEQLILIIMCITFLMMEKGLHAAFLSPILSCGLSFDIWPCCVFVGNHLGSLWLWSQCRWMWGWKRDPLLLCSGCRRFSYCSVCLPISLFRPEVTLFCYLWSFDTIIRINVMCLGQILNYTCICVVICWL